MTETTAADIVQTLTSGKQSSKDPFFLLVGGGMQTGQGSFLSMLAEEKFVEKENMTVITPSAFLSMPGFEPIKDIQHPEKLPHMLGLYQQIVKDAVHKAIENRTSIALVDHGEDTVFIRELHKACKDAGYQTLLAGMSSSPKSYYDYANCTEEFFSRKADHARGFLFLREFSKNFDEYASLFDSTALFESRFSREGDIPSLSMEKIADFSGAPHTVEIYDPAAIERFRHNSLINPLAKTPEEAAANFPKEERTHVPSPQKDDKTLPPAGSLREKFNKLGADKDLSPRILKQFRKIMIKPS